MLAWLRQIVVTLWLVSFGGVTTEEHGPPGETTGNIMQQMAWCKGVVEGVNWEEVLRAAKTGCGPEDPPSEEGPFSMRVRCKPEVVSFCVETLRFLVEATLERSFYCQNGLTFVLSIALVYGKSELSDEEFHRAKSLLWSAVQSNFMLDVSPWPVKTIDILELYDQYLPPLNFDPIDIGDDLEAVTFVVPRCPASLATKLQETFPSNQMILGLDEAARAEIASRHGQHPNWKYSEDPSERPLGLILNEMLYAVNTPLVLIIVGAALPVSKADLRRMIETVSSSRVGAVSGPLIDKNRVFADFCYRFKLKHWRLAFDTTYDWSLNFQESESTAIRGSWFRELEADEKEGPCKLCETLAPTFMARVSVLRSLPPFNPVLDGEWALLDFALRSTRIPLIDAESTSSAPVGQQRTPLLFASCPFIAVREVEGLEAPHLYGRRDKPGGKCVAEPWFSEDKSALGFVWNASTGPEELRPAAQAQLFMNQNSLKMYEGPDGQERHFGCTVKTTNCPVPEWIYRGWAVPPCCKETMKQLLFYIDDLFNELGMKYSVSDGVLLGSYKLGGMLDWDADVDLHIHDDDFDRLRTTEVRERIERDGYYLRAHVNNVSFLLQANDHNYLLIELNKRSEPFDPERLWQVPIEGRLFPAMEEAHLNLSAWYGMSFFTHRLRHVPPWEEDERPMFCATPYHFNCVDEVPQGKDCRKSRRC